MQLPGLGDIYDQYLALTRLTREPGPLHDEPQQRLGGKLLLRTGFDATGIAILVAAGLAGAAALCVDPESERLREGLRHGLCDFLVADLSEALRILKNEIRRQRPVSVCVAADTGALLAEMLRRGVQPDLLAANPSAAAAAFVERGAVPVPPASADSEIEWVEWSVPSEPARVLPLLAQIAAATLDDRRDDTPSRRHWLRHAPRWLGRSWKGRQGLRMTAGEATAFARQVQAEFPTVSLSTGRRPV